MGFNVERFMNAQFAPRESEVPIENPELKKFFDEEKSVWKVRGLTGQESGKANESAERSKNLRAIIEGVISPVLKEKADALKQIINPSTPHDVAKRIEMLQTGSIDPEIDFECAVRICACFPLEFFLITNEIISLTGQGHVPGKPQPSGETQGSKSP